MKIDYIPSLFDFPFLISDYFLFTNSVWKCLLDTENMFDFMYRNTSAEQRKDLVYGKFI